MTSMKSLAILSPMWGWDDLTSKSSSTRPTSTRIRFRATITSVLAIPTTSPVVTY